MSYLTYEEYQNMGGQLSDSAFTSYLWDVESKLNYLTNNRIKYFTDIPEAVKVLIYKLINLYEKNNESFNQISNITGYSNGIETFSFASSKNSSKGSTSFDEKINAIVKEYLSQYPELMYRGKNQWKQKL